MRLNLVVHDSAINGLSAIPEGIQKSLTENLRTLAREIAADARSIAAAHIRFIGATNPGSYLASIYGGVKTQPHRVSGYIRSGSPLAHLMESGASRSAHEELATAGGVLSWLDDAGTAFARRVMIPANKMPAYPAITPAFESARSKVREAISTAIHGT